MNKIFKYPIEIDDKQEISMHKGANILTVGVQNEKMYLWVMVDPFMPKELKKIRVIGTGHDIHDDIKSLGYIGTVQMMDGKLIWHVFEDRQ